MGLMCDRVWFLVNKSANLVFMGQKCTMKWPCHTKHLIQFRHMSMALDRFYFSLLLENLSSLLLSTCIGVDGWV